MKRIKQVLAIDIAKAELVCVLGELDCDLNIKFISHYSTPNNLEGFKNLEKWFKKLVCNDCTLSIVFEATGVYHDRLAHWLHEKSYNLSIVLPNKIANYTKTLNLKTINDKTCSETICKYGLKHKLEYWKPANPSLKKLKQLGREKDQLANELKVIKNQEHAEKTEYMACKSTLKRFTARKKLIKEQIEAIEREQKEIVESDSEIKVRIKRLITIPGIGFNTAVIVLSETNGFNLIRNKRQLTSYAGLDVTQKQSGTSINQKQRISKKGNKFLRKALYFPALVSAKYNPNAKDLLERIVEKNGIKMKGYVAIQRKLLELCYTLDKLQQNYTVNEIKRAPQEKAPLQSSLS
jgi:transposase